jgi:hypothetical protein
MFADPVAINPNTFGGANVSTSYALVGLTGISASLRRVSATAATAPDTLTVSHQESKQGSLKTDRHMARVDRTLIDALLGPVKVSAWIVFEVPRGTTIVTPTEIKETTGRLVAFQQTAGYMDKLINSEP